MAASLLGSAVKSRAAPPPLDFLYPAGAALGSNVMVTVGGKFDPWPVSAWTDAEGLVFEAGTDKGTFQVKASPGLEPGPHLVRLYNAHGASPPRLFLAGELREMSESEPNNAVDQAQDVDALPVTINGRLEKDEDVDSFRLHLNAGTWVIAFVDAYGLDAPIDPLLHLLDTNGTRIAFNHDNRTLDPRLAFHIEHSGPYVLQLSAFAYPPQANIRLAGEAAAVYRLTCSHGPFPSHAFPSGVQRGQKTTVELHGWNLSANSQVLNVELDAAGLTNRQSHVALSCPKGEHRIQVCVGDLPECLESEPNNTGTQAQLVPIPATINGRIATAGDEDRFRFNARKEVSYTAKIHAASLGFALDAVLRIEDMQGKPLARDDDAGNQSDAALTWKAPQDGEYIAVVSDLLRRGGSDYIYRLELSPAQPGIEISMEESAVVLTPGKSAELNLKVTRVHGETNAWTVSASGLPAGVTAEPVSLALKESKAKLSLSAAMDAKPFNGLIEVRAACGEGEQRQVRPVLAKLKGKYAEAGDLLLNELDRLWITVLPKASTEENKAAQ